MKVWLVTYFNIEAVVIGYNTEDEARMAAMRAYTGVILSITEITGPTIIFRELAED